MKRFHVISPWLLPLLMGPLAKHTLRDHLVQWSHFTERETEAQPEDVTGKVASRAGKARSLLGSFLRRCPLYFPPKVFRDLPSHYSLAKRSQVSRSSGGLGPMRSSWLSWAESSAPGPQTNRPLIPLLPSSQTSLFNVPALHGKRRANSTWFLSCSKVNFWPIRFVDNWCQLLFSTSELSHPFTCSKCPHR